MSSDFGCGLYFFAYYVDEQSVWLLWCRMTLLFQVQASKVHTQYHTVYERLLGKV